MDQIYKKYVSDPSKKGDFKKAPHDEDAWRSLTRDLMEANTIPESQRENDIDSVFHSFSHNKDESTDGERDIDMNNGQSALDELLRRWDINLNEKESGLLNNSFQKQWRNYVNANDKLDSTQAVQFVRSVIDDVMSTPIGGHEAYD